MTNNEATHPTDSDIWPLAPSLDWVYEEGQAPPQAPRSELRLIWLAFLAIVLGLVAAVVAVLLVNLIFATTNLAFFGRFSLQNRSPADNRLGWLVIFVPVIGGLIVGFMAKYGSRAIRGHGIPEAIEQVLVNRSKIPVRVTFLKPLSAAISIGTGGPFGAEGPIIATGGALGSLLGQVLHITSTERKTLLAAGAAAGMSAIFGSPISAVLLAVELLLFEFRAQSLIPVALASATAAGLRILWEGGGPIFSMPHVDPAPLAGLALYLVLGVVIGVLAVAVTWIVYAIEDAFELLPIHWMWWPSFGALAVGVIGYFEPHTLGVGYENISALLEQQWPWQFVLWLCTLKFLSWSISLGSGTSGGTLAPLLTIGGAAGHLLGGLLAVLLPSAGVDVRIAALVGMASIFAGASRAMLASAVFAFETTLQPATLLPLIAGCCASLLTARLLMQGSIMTIKITRRGIRTPTEYIADPLQQITVGEIGIRRVVTLRATQTVGEVRQWLNSNASGTSHQGFPVLSDRHVLVGVLTRRDLLDKPHAENTPLQEIIRVPVKFVYETTTVRQAADHMVNHGIGRLPVVSSSKPHQVVGIVTRSDILSAYRRYLEEAKLEEPSLRFVGGKRANAPGSPDPEPAPPVESGRIKVDSASN